MSPTKALWGKSDFTRIALIMRESVDALVRLPALFGHSPDWPVILVNAFSLYCGPRVNACDAREEWLGGSYTEGTFRSARKPV